MPRYSFRHKETDELQIVEMKISEREDWIKNNPDWVQTIESVIVVDPVGIGVTKPPSDFTKYVLGPMKERMGKQPNIIGERRWDIPKEI